MPTQNKRYTPKRSAESIRQSWLTKNPDDPSLSAMGRAIALAARNPRQWERVLLGLNRKLPR